jgi:hypothetical protein
MSFAPVAGSTLDLVLPAEEDAGQDPFAGGLDWHYLLDDLGESFDEFEESDLGGLPAAGLAAPPPPPGAQAAALSAAAGAPASGSAPCAATFGAAAASSGPPRAGHAKPARSRPRSRQGGQALAGRDIEAAKLERADRQRLYRQRVKLEKAMLQAEVAAAQRELEALRLERAGLVNHGAALERMSQYTEAALDAAIAGRAAEREAASQSATPAGGAAQAFSVVAAAVFNALPHAALQGFVTTPSAAQLRQAESACIPSPAVPPCMRTEWAARGAGPPP